MPAWILWGKETLAKELHDSYLDGVMHTYRQFQWCRRIMSFAVVVAVSEDVGMKMRGL